MSYRENFSEANALVKVAFLIVFVSLSCSWLAFTTTSWLIIGSFNFGLWRRCQGSICANLDGTAQIEYGVTQAFAIIGFMCQNLAFLLIVRFIFKDSCRGNSEVSMASAILLIVSAVGWLIAVAVFGGEYNVPGAQLHYSYGLAVVACGLGLFSGIVMALGGGANGSVGSK